METPRNEFNKLIKENLPLKEDCIWCQESRLAVGQKTPYGATIIYKTGNSENGWFATLSPKTGGLDKDFTIQLMPFKHLTHFAQLNNYPKLAKNYGIIFSKISAATTKIIAEEDPDFKAVADLRENGASVATYGKCTAWKEKKEHLHIKVVPFRGNIGQPYTVDSSFGRKKRFKEEDGDEFIKMKPVKKNMIAPERFNQLSNALISILK